MFALYEKATLQHPSTTTSSSEPAESSKNCNLEPGRPKWASTETFGSWFSSLRTGSAKLADVESGILTERQKKYLARTEINDTNVLKRKSPTLPMLLPNLTFDSS